MYECVNTLACEYGALTVKFKVCEVRWLASTVRCWRPGSTPLPQVFERVLSSRGILGSKTRILVTHTLWCLPHTDEIVMLDAGRVRHQGTFQQLVSWCACDFATAGAPCGAQGCGAQGQRPCGG